MSSDQLIEQLAEHFGIEGRPVAAMQLTLRRAQAPRLTVERCVSEEDYDIGCLSHLVSNYTLTECSSGVVAIQ